MSLIHPTAIIDPKAELDSSVSVGPYTVIGAGVQIGAGSSVGPHTVICGPTRIGQNNRIWNHASVGADPQDKKFYGEEAWLEIGDDNTIREFVTLNRGTGVGGGVTRIGNNNWIMANVHVGHDTIIGSHNILANNTSFGGHCIVEDYVNFGGYSMIHQFCRVGAYAFTGFMAKVNGDIPPYTMIGADMSRPRGINSEGLRRRGFSSEQITAIKRAFKIIYRSDLQLVDALEQLKAMSDQHPEITRVIEFIEASERGLLR